MGWQKPRERENERGGNGSGVSLCAPKRRLCHFPLFLLASQPTGAGAAQSANQSTVISSQGSTRLARSHTCTASRSLARVRTGAGVGCHRGLLSSVCKTIFSRIFIVEIEFSAWRAHKNKKGESGGKEEKKKKQANGIEEDRLSPPPSHALSTLFYYTLFRWQRGRRERARRKRWMDIPKGGKGSQREQERAQTTEAVLNWIFIVKCGE